MNQRANKAVLMFTPHPDDHISAAGTVFKLQSKGYDFYEVLFADGETSGQLGQVDTDPEEVRKVRVAEFEKGSKVLGTKKYFRLSLPNDNINYSPETFFRLIEIIREVRPAIAIIPHPTDYHRDHRIVSEIAADVLLRADNSFALHLGDRFRVPVVLYCRGVNPITKTDLLVNITPYFDKVTELLMAYNSQVTERMKQYSESLPSLTGYYMRAKYAEEFEIPRNLPIIPNQVLADLAD